MRTTKKSLNSRPTPVEPDADLHLKPERGPARLAYLPVSLLKPHPRNPRIHSGKQIHQIAASIEEFGFVNPILVDAENRIIAGHGRFEAAKLLGLERVPTVCIDHLSPTQRRAYVIADNKLAEKAGWDRDILKLEFEELFIAEPSLELELTGFETSEIDLLLDGQSHFVKDDPLNRVPPAPSVPVSRLGDLWELGDHRIFCGDARERSNYSLLMRDEPARLVFTDPPYNVPIDGHVSGLGKVKHREFPMACGEMTKEEFTNFLATVFRNAAEVTKDGAIHFVCMDWRHIEEILLAGGDVYTELKNVCVWTKDNGGMGSFYRSQHELVFVFKAGSGRHINTVQLGAHGRYRTNVWNYPGASSMPPGRDAELPNASDGEAGGSRH